MQLYTYKEDALPLFDKIGKRLRFGSYDQCHLGCQKFSCAFNLESGAASKSEVFLMASSWQIWKVVLHQGNHSKRLFNVEEGLAMLKRSAPSCLGPGFREESKGNPAMW